MDDSGSRVPVPDGASGGAHDRAPDPAPDSAPDPAPDPALAWLQATIWLGAALPLLLFALVGWALYQQAVQAARLHVERTARVAAAHALKVFETNEALLDRVADPAASRAPRDFSDFYRELSLNTDGMQVTLRHADGAVLAAWPAGAPATQPGVVAGAPAAASVAGLSAACRGCINAERRVGHYPVVVAVSIAQPAALSPWLRQMAFIGGFGFPIAVALVCVAWVGLQRTRRVLQAQHALQLETAHRQRIEDTMTKAQKTEALGRLSGGVAHDFNNLLTVVGNNAYLLRRLRPEAAGSAQLAAIDRAVAAGTKLTRQLLSFSRRQPLRPARVHLQTHIADIAELVAPAVGAAVVIETHVQPDTAPVQVDVSELELAVLNLALNARDAMAGGGRLRITAANATAAETGGLDGRFVVVAVQDNGCGVPPELRGRVFEPFFTTKARGHGTGLGLSQVRGFCQAAGGRASLASASGQGTTVRMILPAAPAAEVAAAGSAPAEQTGGALNGLRVLLVKDNAEAAFATATVLESLGCQVRQVSSADAALEVLRAEFARVDVVLSDILMSGSVDGIGLAATVTAEMPAVPIVLISGYPSSLEKAAALGVAVLPKPSTPAALASALLAAMPRPRGAGSTAPP